MSKAAVMAYLGLLPASHLLSDKSVLNLPATKYKQIGQTGIPLMSIETMKFVSKSLSCYRLLYRRFVSFNQAKRPDEHP